MPRKRSKKLSILLCTYQNEHAVIPSLFELSKQNLPRSQYEIILVGDGVDLLECARRNNIEKYIYVDNPNNLYHPNRVRNEGIKQCEGKLVFLLHDNIFDLQGTDYLQKLWRLSEKGTKAVYTANCVKTFAFDENHKIILTNTMAANPTGFYAHQDAVPLHYLRKVMGFDEMFDGDKGYDDKDLEKRLIQIGCEFVDGGELTSVKYNMREIWRAQEFPNTSKTGSRNADIIVSRNDSGYYAPKNR